MEYINKFTKNFLWFILLIVVNNVYGLSEINSTSVYWKNLEAHAKRFPTYIEPYFYQLETTGPLRDNFPASQVRFIKQSRKYPIVETNSHLFDSIYALSIDDLIKNSVEQITDYSFKTSICHCFETGKKVELCLD